MNSKEIRAVLTKWAKKQFEGAEAIEVVKNKFGNWNVRVDWVDGYDQEIYSFAYKNGKFQDLGVTTFNY